MRIIFNGLPYFGKKLAQDLNEFAPKHSFMFFDTYYSKIDQIKFAVNLPFADLVVSMNGVSDKSGSLDLVLKMKNKLWMQWQGTDAMLALERAKNNTIDRKYIDYAKNFAIAPWLKDELKAIDVNCEILVNQWVVSAGFSEKKFERIGVYSYIPKGKEAFYGWEIIKYIAEKKPEISFYIFGTKGEELSKLKNITFLGLVTDENIKEIQNRLPIYIRLTEHDGYSYMVIEALSNGSEVIWSMPHERCHLLNSMEKAEMVFDKVVNDLNKRGLTRNESNILFVKENFSREIILKKWIEKIEEVGK